MRQLKSATLLTASAGLILSLGGPALAQSSSSAAASGPNAGASASAGSSTSGPCRVISPEEAARRGTGTSVNTGPGGLSGTATIGPDGPRVTIGPGVGTTGPLPGPGGAQAHASASSECVIVAPR